MENFWYRYWFNEKYLMLYGHRNHSDALDQINLYLNTACPLKTDRILDLACGQGRHCNILHNKGYRVEGLDLSPALLSLARQKYPHITFHQSDMRQIPGRYNHILSLFTSFGYFKDKENEKVIKNIAASLLPGGIIWLDFFNSSYIKKNLVKKNQRVNKKGVTISEEREINNKRIYKKIFIEKNNKKEKYIESVRMYTKEELCTLLKKYNFTVKNIIGDYYGKKWHKDSRRTIVFGKLNET
ncbi:MAG TPA: class I SAM-dependent methyltransferase [Spirochaetota bacterium]|nr:class I SAM-dependent methyltransferase [Spirochaetota bacterium]